jgi:hypothetical protein
VRNRKNADLCVMKGLVSDWHHISRFVTVPSEEIFVVVCPVIAQPVSANATMITASPKNSRMSAFEFIRLSTALLFKLRKAVEAVAVPVIQEDRLPAIPPAHHMADRPRILDGQ